MKNQLTSNQQKELQTEYDDLYKRKRTSIYSFQKEAEEINIKHSHCFVDMEPGIYIKNVDECLLDLTRPIIGVNDFTKEQCLYLPKEFESSLSAKTLSCIDMLPRIKDLKVGLYNYDLRYIDNNFFKTDIEEWMLQTAAHTRFEKVRKEIRPHVLINEKEADEGIKLSIYRYIFANVCRYFYGIKKIKRNRKLLLDAQRQLKQEHASMDSEIEELCLGFYNSLWNVYGEEEENSSYLDVQIEPLTKNSMLIQVGPDARVLEWYEHQLQQTED